MALLSHDLI